MHTILSALCLIAFGCLWDSDTLRDEASLRPDAWEVITGQYPRHGEAYYRLRIAQLGLVVVPDRQQRIDLAAAQIRLKQFAAAERALASLIAEAPDVYEAITDLAVLHRNQGRPAEAVPLFERALALHPAGHLGLGDWTLRAARWQARVLADPLHAARENFLGEPRVAMAVAEWTEGGPWDQLPPATRDRLQKHLLLLRSYPSFAEGYATLGDELSGIGDRTLALYAYARALELQHPDPKLVTGRLHAAAAQTLRWGSQFMEEAQRPAAAAAALAADLQQELTRCRAWQDAFVRAEDAAVARKHLPSFAETLAAMPATAAAVYLPSARADRRKAVDKAWVEGLEALRQRDFPAAERVLGKATTLAKTELADHSDRARLLVAFAASLSPQGGEARLRQAAAALIEAERLLRTHDAGNTTDLRMVLGNLALVHEALHEPALSAQDRARRDQVDASR